jgi:hypothetical protein
MTALELEAGGARKEVRLADYLDAAGEERAREAEYQWIKTLRHLAVDGLPFRRRFTLRGDSLWWFAELYLHKRQTILRLHRTIAAFRVMVAREQPSAIRLRSAEDAGVVRSAAAALGVRILGSPGDGAAVEGIWRMDARATGLAAAARLSRMRARSGRGEVARGSVAAFVHRAFWQSGTTSGGAEAYIGPVLAAIEARLPSGQLRYVGIGPASNFRVRRWWRPDFRGAAILPIERLAPWSAMRESRAIFRERRVNRDALYASDAIRAHAVIDQVDCWPAVMTELAGIALLQFPWSARAMDEAAAALEAVEPRVAVTYAEAGGWGRAIALECRRRSIPFAGIQHGFIYRHWLNYRHEPDELAADPGHSTDGGFPLPDRTLLFDEYARRHLEAAGHVPPDRLRVTGSARLDELAAAIRSMPPGEVARARGAAGAGREPLLLLAAKEREIRGVLPAFVRAVGGYPDIRLAIKPHPAETAAAYASVIEGCPNIRVLPIETPLAACLAAADAVVTMNSTVAVDALALGIPALVIGLPNNLTPFVETGAMAGASTPDEMTTAIAKVLYNQEFRTTVRERSGSSPRDGRAAARAADAVLELGRLTPAIERTT